MFNNTRHEMFVYRRHKCPEQASLIADDHLFYDEYQRWVYDLDVPQFATKWHG